MHSFVTLDDIVVVIVDDDDDVRFSLAKFLCQHGATVFPCSNAGEALEAVRIHHPNLYKPFRPDQLLSAVTSTLDARHC